MTTKVSIVKTSGENIDSLRSAVRKALSLLGSPLDPIGPASSVVIKPNITADSISWQQGVVTNPHLIRAIAELVAEKKPKEILVAEAIACGLDVKKAYPFLGYDQIAQETGARLVDLYDQDFKQVAVSNAQYNSCLEISRTVLEADFLINVPVMKAHVATGISVCMKNLMGTISVEQKKKFHFLGIAESILELNSVVKPNLCIADGTVAGEGDGPVANTPVGFKTLLAGTDARAIDIISAKVMGFEREEVEILSLADQRWGVLDDTDIQVVGERLDQVIRPFKRAAGSVSPPEGVVCEEGNACPACAGALELALKRAEQMGILDELKPLQIICGPDAGTGKSSGNTLVVGKCLAHLKDIGNYVPGCPPQVFLVTDELREMAGIDRIFGCKDGYIF